MEVAEREECHGLWGSVGQGGAWTGLVVDGMVSRGSAHSPPAMNVTAQEDAVSLFIHRLVSGRRRREATLPVASLRCVCRTGAVFVALAAVWGGLPGMRGYDDGAGLPGQQRANAIAIAIATSATAARRRVLYTAVQQRRDHCVVVAVSGLG
jgi:hypothetical protein